MLDCYDAQRGIVKRLRSEDRMSPTYMHQMALSVAAYDSVGPGQL